MTPPIIRLTGVRGGWPKAFEFSFSRMVPWSLLQTKAGWPLFYQYLLSFAVAAGKLLQILCGSAEPPLLSPPSLSS